MQQRLSYARSWAFLLLWLSGTITPVSLVAVAFNGKAFLSSESGACALDARSNPMNVGPQPVTAGFAELGCNLLAQTSRVHALIGSGAKMGQAGARSTVLVGLLALEAVREPPRLPRSGRRDVGLAGAAADLPTSTTTKRPVV